MKNLIFRELTKVNCNDRSRVKKMQDKKNNLKTLTQDKL